MSNPTQAILQVSVDAGPPQKGAVDVDYGAVFVASLENPAGVDRAEYRIWEYPEGFECPAGWSELAGGLGYYVVTLNGAAAPAVELPADTLWGKYFLSVEVNKLSRNGVVAPELFDDSLVLKIASASGLEDVGYLEANQNDSLRQWVGPMKQNLRALDAALGSPTTFLPYRIDRAIATGKFLDLSGESNADSLFLSPDGTKLFVLAKDSDEIVQFTLSTPRDLDTATMDGVFSVGGQEATPEAITFNATGTRMYMCGTIGDDINQYNLGTAWEIVSDPPTFAGSESISAQTGAPQGLLLSPDGATMLVGSGASTIIEYSLSTPDEVIGGSLSHVATTASLGFTVSGMWWGEDRAGTPGGALFWCKAGTTIAARKCPTPYSIVGSSAEVPDFVPPGSPGVSDLQFMPDGNKVWTIGSAGINEYYTSAAVPAA